MDGLDRKERKLVVVLLSVAFSMMISGCFFVSFVIHVWGYLANLAGDKDVFLAAILLLYFVIFALIGASAGLLLNAALPSRVEILRRWLKRARERLKPRLK